MARFADRRSTEQVALRVVRQSTDEPTPLSPVEAHAALYGDAADPALAAPIWQEAIRAAQEDQTSDGHWRLLAIWLALPRLTGTVRRIATRLRVNRADLESEMILAFLERLPTVDPTFPDAIDLLTRAARSSAWRYARAGDRNIPSADIESVAFRRGHLITDTSGGTHGFDSDAYELEISPPAESTGLRAGIRFAVLSRQAEGEQLGILARRLNLHDVVRQVRQAGDRHKVGTLFLRPRRRRP
ncbi:hypothetical protein ABTY96_33760 [Streptomyces sp. NPDC096057]|uniref:hypothetical protein n=1 Tax=Streptomyces sp. NPDC096057 TaxID=3155543 RepID=UPI00331BB0A4